MKNRITRLVPWLLLIVGTLPALAQQRGNLGETIIDTSRRQQGQANSGEDVNITGYIQPQCQIGESPGQRSFNGGDFPLGVESRFSVRRGRLRVDYARYDAQRQPVVLFVFQFDGTERGVQTRDFWGRYYENKLNVLHLTAGIFARPFGFEINYSSSDRESPERGRMSQLLMRTERDIGAMLTFEPRNRDHPLRFLKADLGLFNGPGLASLSDYDNHKDVIGRLSIKPQKFTRQGATITGSVSGYFGGIGRFTNEIYQMSQTERRLIPSGATDVFRFVRDTSAVQFGQLAPRRYYGADVQIRFPNRKGYTELRAEYIAGWQTATQNSTETPGSIPTLVGPAPGTPTSASVANASPLYVRRFDGAYFYFLQHLGSTKHQLVVKYDWYDPNKLVRGRQLDVTFTWADIRYDTIGFGYLWYATDNLKLVLWYDVPVNEATNVPGYERDAPDNLLTIRTQYRF